jgi:hypothetical protein
MEWVVVESGGGGGVVEYVSGGGRRMRRRVGGCGSRSVERGGWWWSVERCEVVEWEGREVEEGMVGWGGLCERGVGGVCVID